MRITPFRRWLDHWRQRSRNNRNGTRANVRVEQLERRLVPAILTTYNVAERLLEIQLTSSEVLFVEPENLETFDQTAFIKVNHDRIQDSLGNFLQVQHVDHLRILGSPENDNIEVFFLPRGALDFVGITDGSITIDGAGGDDTVNGGPLAEMLIGGSGDDVLLPQNNDSIDGGGGDDLVIFGAQNDLAITRDAGSILGDGLTRVTITNQRLTRVLERPLSSSLTFESPLASIEQFDVGTASPGRRKTHVDGSAFTGEMTLTGSLFEDTLIGGSGNDVIFGTLQREYDQDIHSDFDNDNNSLVGGGGDDFIFGGIRSDTIRGGTGNDVLNGFEADHRDPLFERNLLFGEDGDDIAIAHPWSFNVQSHFDFVGGDGDDTADFSAAGILLRVNLSLFEYRSSLDQPVIGFIDAENVIGAGGDDTLIGSSDANELDGGPGDDVIEGRDGDDTLKGDDGNDVLVGGADDDLLIGGVGDDQLFGEDERDALLGGAGADLLVGGQATDVGDGRVDLSVTIVGHPTTIEVGDRVVYTHTFRNLGEDVAVDPRVKGRIILGAAVTAPQLDERIGTPILHPITGADTGHTKLAPGQTITVIINGTGAEPGIGSYHTSIFRGEDDITVDPNALNNLFTANTTVLPRIQPPRIISEEGENGRTPGSSSSTGNSLVELSYLSGNGNSLAFVTNVDLFPQPLYRTPASFQQVGVGDPILASINAEGTFGGNSFSSSPVLSFDGTKVVFSSLATDLISGFVDNNGSGRGDLFFRDLLTGVTQLVTASVNRPGGQDTFEAVRPLLSDDGRFVFFNTRANDLVAGDVNDKNDTFVFDSTTGTTELVSVEVAGYPADGGSSLQGISYDGRFVLLSKGDLFLKDRQTGTITLITAEATGNPDQTPANRFYSKAVVSPDGRFVAFTSKSNKLVSGVTDIGSGTSDLFVRDVENSTTQIVSVSRDGTTARQEVDNGTPFALSDDGRFVAFESFGSDLASGFPDAQYKIYVRDLQTGMTRPVTLNAAGTARATTPDGFSSSFRLSSMSADGRFVAFSSQGTDHVTGVTDAIRSTRDDDVFVRDLLNNTTTVASRNSAGTATGNRAADSAMLSRDGQKVFFLSEATNLVRHFTDGSNFTFDIFSNSDHVSLVYIAPNGNGADDLTLHRNGDLLQIFDNRTNTVVASRLASDTAAVLIQGSDNENDTIRVDFSGGSLSVPNGIQFDGGLDTAGTNQDRVFFVNGSFDTVQYDLTGAANGFVSFDDAVFVYDFTEPLVDQTAAANRIVNNVIAGNQQMTLQDDGTSNNGLSRVAFTGPNSPPSLIFANPTESLEFNTFAGNDTFTATGLDAGLLADVQDNVTPVSVNAAPTFTAGPNQTVTINSGARTVANWAKNISAGPANESAQALNFLVIADNSALFTVLPAVSFAGTLTFTPAADATGAATVFVRLLDDGGTENGGINVSGFQSFTITVTEGFVGPTFTSGPNQTVDEDSGLHTVANWATDLTAPNVESPTFTFVVTNDNNSLFSIPPTVLPDGTLSFRSAPNAFGEATVTVKLVVNGEMESAEQTFTITVNDVAEPVFNPVTLALVAANENTRLQVNASNSHVELVNAATNAVLLDLTAGGVTQLTLNGGRQDNRLTVDFANGNPLPSDGLFFNGGRQRRHDDLVLTGGSFDSVTHTFANRHDGTVTIDGSMITYTGLEPITDNLATVNRVFEFAATNDAITLADAARAVNGRLKLTSVRSSESVEFASPSGSLTIRAGSGNDQVTLRSLDPNFLASAATLIVEGNDGNDVLDALRVSKAVTLRGGTGRDFLLGGSANDLLQGGDDRDLLYGKRGDDTLAGDADRDYLSGGDGDDSLSGGDGDDSIRGSDGADQLFGDDGNDTLRGDAGTDTLLGGADHDFLAGGSDADLLAGQAGQDSLYGDGGNDTLFGGTGNDRLRGGSGNDALLGEDGDDKLFGDSGPLDTLSGGDGNDILIGSANEIDDLFVLDLDDLLS